MAISWGESYSMYVMLLALPRALQLPTPYLHRVIMLDKSHILSHAKSAVDQTARSLTEMHERLETAELSRQHRLIVEDALHDLSRRHEMLADLYEDMLDVPASDLPAHWQRFFVCYDDYLGAVRDAKCRLVMDAQ